jgi:hypothetical protein
MTHWKIAAILLTGSACATAAWLGHAGETSAAVPNAANTSVQNAPADRQREPVAPPSSAATSASRVRTNDTPSAATQPSADDDLPFEALLEQARALTPSERSEQLAELDQAIDRERWVERANREELSGHERIAFKHMLQERNALSIASAEALLAALDEEQEP